MPMVIRTDRGDWLVDTRARKVELTTAAGHVRGEVVYAYETNEPIAFVASPADELTKPDGVLKPGTYLLVKVV